MNVQRYNSHRASLLYMNVQRYNSCRVVHHVKYDGHLIIMVYARLRSGERQESKQSSPRFPIQLMQGGIQFAQTFPEQQHHATAKKLNKKKKLEAEKNKKEGEERPAAGEHKPYAERSSSRPAPSELETAGVVTEKKQRGEISGKASRLYRWRRRGVRVQRRLAEVSGERT
ncbi:uncharacterized protein LOC111482708 [Cucurbita maxima]|uniref:Uncharacterized protein LOC111482708 n=1 Tax=Cucurbita maxima TaxID=3661 RepID=A0A6J1J548_CUCMA|nr:uncharacterized protein LOC111482708 [Cucurbita maxima]